MASLEVRLLGGFELRLNGTPVVPFPLRKARSLLAFLIINRDRSHTRDLLAGTFWPHLHDTAARRRLSQSMWQVGTRLRSLKESGTPPILTVGDTVRFNPDIDTWLDLDEFEQSVREGSSATQLSLSEKISLLETAVLLYRGDLLNGFYDDWATSDRERLRELFLGALQTLTDLLMGRGDYEAALIRARTLAQHDPFREEAHQRVMRLQVLLGRRAEALRQYEICRQILADELHTEPSHITNELRRAAALESAISQQTSNVPKTTSTSETEGPFSGRDEERARVRQYLDAAIAGSGRLVLVEGEAGMGKTRLLTEIAKDANWRGMDVLWGSSSGPGRRPYASLAEALTTGLDPLRIQRLETRLAPVWFRQLSLLIPTLSLAHTHEQAASTHLHATDEQARMTEAVVLAFLALADVSPLLLVLDGMQWADADTVRALSLLGERASSHRIVVVVAYRRTQASQEPTVWTMLRSLDQQRSSTRISLEPLSPDQIEALLSHCLGLTHVDPDLTAKVLEETGGVPLLVIEVLRAIQDPEDQGDPHAGATPPSPQVPLTTAALQLVRERIADITDGSRAVLDLLCLHPDQLRINELVTASELSSVAVLQAVDELIRRQLVTETSGGYQPSHALLRRVLLTDLPEETIPALHRSLALAVERHRPEDVELLAQHFLAANMPDRAAHYLEHAAARAISVSAYETAADRLAQALRTIDSIGGPPEREFRVASLLEEVLDVLARRDEQGDVLERMRRTAPDDAIGDVRRRRSWWLAHQDQFDEAEAEARTAVECARSAGNGGRLVAALSTLGMIACFAGRAAEGIAYLEQAAGLRGADLPQQADARNALGQNLLDLQRFEEAELQLLAALALYTELNDHRGEAEVLGTLGTLRIQRGEPALAEAAILRALETSRQIGYRHGEAVYGLNLGILQAMTNRPRSAFQAFERAANTYALMGNRRGRALVLSNSAWLRHAVLGDDEGAENDALEALSVYQHIRDPRGEAQCRATIGSIRYRSGDLQEASRHLHQSLERAQGAGDSWIEAQILKEWARCELDSGLVEQGLEHAGRALAICSSLGLRDLATSIRALQGRLLVASGQPEEALIATTEAIRDVRIGVEGSHLVPFSHGLALAALGRQQEADHYLEIAHSEVLSLLSDLSDADRDSALMRVPALRAIVEVWAERQPIRIQVQLPRLGAPRGRSLADGDRVAVTWTLQCATDLTISPVIAQRRQRLLRLLAEAAAQGASPAVSDLAGALGVSAATTRRDLAFLRGQGHEVPTRGSRPTRR